MGGSRDGTVLASCSQGALVLICDPGLAAVFLQASVYPSEKWGPWKHPLSIPALEGPLIGLHPGVATADCQHVGKHRQRDIWGAGKRSLALGAPYPSDLVAISLDVCPGRFSLAGMKEEEGPVLSLPLRLATMSQGPDRTQHRSGRCAYLTRAPILVTPGRKAAASFLFCRFFFFFL